MSKISVAVKVLGRKRKESGGCSKAIKDHKRLEKVQTTVFCRLLEPPMFELFLSYFPWISPAFKHFYYDCFINFTL